MKIQRAWVVFSFALVTPALAGDIEINSENQAVLLPACHGTLAASVSFEAGKEILRLEFDRTDCELYEIAKSDGGKVEYVRNPLPMVKGGFYSGSRTVPAESMKIGKNALRVKLSSSNGDQSDSILIRFKSAPLAKEERKEAPKTHSEPDPKQNPVTEPKVKQPHEETARPKDEPSKELEKEPGTVSRLALSAGEEAELHSCGGKIRITKTDPSSGTPLEMVLSGVRWCSNYEVMESDGVRTKKSGLPIDGVTSGAREGTFPLTRDLASDGAGFVVISIQSPSKKTRELVTIHFPVVEPQVPSSPTEEKNGW